MHARAADLHERDPVMARLFYGEAHALSEWPARPQPRRLPAVLRGATGGARGRLDAHGRPVLARAAADRFAPAARLHRDIAVRTHSVVFDRDGRVRRPVAQA